MLLLTDFRDGILGRISLETPATRAAMLEAASKAPVAVKEIASEKEE
jgi:ribosome biogenesis GTPase A